MTANIIAEALAAAERETPRIGSPEIFCVLFDSGNTHWTDDVPDGLTSGVGNEETCVHVRSDFFLAALAHLAAKLVRAEAQAAERGREEMARAFWVAVCESRADNIEVNAQRSESFPDFAPEWAGWAAERRAEATQLRGWAKEVGR